MTAKAQHLGGAFVHGRRGRMRDRRAQQTGQNAAAGGGRLMDGRLHYRVALDPVAADPAALGIGRVGEMSYRNRRKDSAPEI
jgi:hypothetical protein